MNKLKKSFGILMALALCVNILPAVAFAAEGDAETLFAASDLHGSETLLQEVLSELDEAPGAMVMVGDSETYENGIRSYAQEVWPSFDGGIYMSASDHDEGYVEDKTIELANTDAYIVYSISMTDMTNAVLSQEKAEDFLKAYQDVTGKVIFVSTHVPLHQRRGDNLGASYWVDALNKVELNGNDVILLWAHNHTGETSFEKESYYFCPAREEGTAIMVQDTEKTAFREMTIYFTYMNAGYLYCNGQKIEYMNQGTLFTVHGDTIDIKRVGTGKLYPIGGEGYTFTLNRNPNKRSAAENVEHRYEITGHIWSGFGGHDELTMHLTCTDCGDEQDVMLPFRTIQTDYIVAPTCTEEGRATYTGSFTLNGQPDSYSEEGVAPASGHSYKKTVCTECGSIMFNDVVPENWFAEAVSWAFDEKVIPAAEDMKFTPNAPCDNISILNMIWSVVGSPIPTLENPFSNVSESDPWFDAVVWAYEQGLVESTTLDIVPCTRSAVVTYLWKLAGQTDSKAEMNFTDVPADADYVQAIAWGLENGVLHGRGNGTFGPDEICTRAEIVQFLYNFTGGKHIMRQF